MATLYISEFKQGVSGIGSTWAQMLPQPAIADQVVAVGAGSLQSVAFNPLTRAVLLATDTACSIVFGDAPVAATTNLRIPANAPPFPFAVQPGQKVAVIASP